MPALTNARHELFAQAIFKGASATAAYARAGYKPSEAHASRLAGNGKVKARIAELQAAAALKLVEHISFDAKDMFKRLEAQIAEAKAAGDHKTAMDGRKFMLTCFGYEDSPTLTNEHVRDQPLKPAEAAAVEDERADRTVIRLADGIRALRKRMG